MTVLASVHLAIAFTANAWAGAVPPGVDVDQNCIPAAQLGTPQCTAEADPCLAREDLAVCVREGDFLRVAMCSPEGDPHLVHPFSWSVLGELPRGVRLMTPLTDLPRSAPRAVNSAVATSTAYLGGIREFFSPHGLNRIPFAGKPRQAFCGTPVVRRSDVCNGDPSHTTCVTDYHVAIHVIGLDEVPGPKRLEASELPVAFVGEPYVATIPIAGGPEGYRFTVISQELPPGMTLDAKTGRISGTTDEERTHHFTVEAIEDPDLPAFTAQAACAAAPPCTRYRDTRSYAVRVLAQGATTTTTTVPTGASSTTLPPRISSTTTSSSTLSTTTSSTSSTLFVVPEDPQCPTPSGICSRPLTAGQARTVPTTSDCAYILRAAVLLEPCCRCPCDTTGDGRILAEDALRCLLRVVGRSGVTLHCGGCPVGG